MIDGYIEKRKIVQGLCSLSGLSNEARDEVREMIDRCPKVDLLERDQGKTPILEEGSSLIHESRADGSSGFVEKPFLDWKCPICGWFVGELYCGHGRYHIQGESSYCERCGQKIDWTKPSEEEKTRYEKRKAEEREAFRRENGISLDNMNEGRRRKYGMLNEEV